MTVKIFKKKRKKECQIVKIKNGLKVQLKTKYNSDIGSELYNLSIN